MERRDFIKTTLVSGAGLFATGSGLLSTKTYAAGISAPDVLPLVTLGRTGAQVSKLGFGCFPWSWDIVTPGVIHDIVHRGLELGVTYLDIAPNYRDAEEKLGESLPEVRDKIFLVSKTEEPTYEGTWNLLKQSLKRMKTDRIELIHLHNWGDVKRWADIDFVLSDKGAVGALREARKQGIIKYIGVSGHFFPSRFHKILDSHEVDVIMNAVNFVNQHTYDFEHKVWARAAQENLGMVAMKVFGGDTKTKNYRITDEYYDLAVRYAYSLPGLSTAVIGMKSVAELEQAVNAVKSVTPLTDEERFDLAKRGLELAQKEEWRAAHGKPLT